VEYWSWDDSLSIGIDAIDEQHKRLVAYINELQGAHKEQDEQGVARVLHGLVDYTVTHFAFEEALMARVGYPLSEGHKKVHEAFITHINRYAERHAAGEQITRRLISDLQIWLTNHIKNDDRHYVSYYKGEQSKPAEAPQQYWLQRAWHRIFSWR